jgi:carbonic anhydrase/acetyltransferase-like protein (isoleucine patch superfamily)
MNSFYLALEKPGLLLGEGAYIAPTARLIGDVQIGRASSVWFGAVLRGDSEKITLGNESNIQDNAVLHTDPGIPMEIGDRVTVGHLAMLHGCTVGNGSLIGIGSVVLNHARIGCNCLIAAKSLVPEGMVIADNSIVRGIPGRVVGEVTDRHLDMMGRSCQAYVARASRFAACRL